MQAHKTYRTTRKVRTTKKSRIRGGATFACELCGGISRVLETRCDTEIKGLIWRKRRCLDCSHTFKTQERLV